MPDYQDYRIAFEQAVIQALEDGLSRATIQESVEYVFAKLDGS